MSECSHDCSSCSENCSEKKLSREEMIAPLHELSSVKKVIGVVSGKGGVGKSMVSSMLAVAMNKKGFRTAILDADITGPSIPRSFGIKGMADGDETGIYPIPSKNGIQVMSVNLLLHNETDPVVWRGPVISGMITQFWSNVVWGDVDFMFVDMPPGTGDVPLTVFQSLPVDGLIVVTSPQQLVSMIVSKAVSMANLMSVPILGLVENMSWYQCPDCGKKHNIFGESHIEDVAARYGIPVLAQLPINPEACHLADEGRVEEVDCSLLDNAVNAIEGLL